MNRKGIIGTIMIVPVVTVIILVLVVGFLYVVNYIDKPKLEIKKNLNSEIPLFDKININENGVVKDMLVVEGLIRYSKEVRPYSGKINEGFEREFVNAVANLFVKEVKDENGVRCLAYSLERGNAGIEKRRIFFAYDKSMEGKKEVSGEEVIRYNSLIAGVNEGFSAGGISDKASINGDYGEDIAISGFMKELKQRVGSNLAIKDLPRIGLVINGENVDIYYYYGECAGGVFK